MEMSNSENLDEISLGSKVAKKVWYPFGSPSHKRHAFSDFSHLTGQTQQFAIDLATATGIEPDIRESTEIKKEPEYKPPPPSAASKKKKIKVQINPDLLQDPLFQNDGGEACSKKACQEVIKNILESQSRNKIEREEIIEEFDRLNADLQQNEQVNEALESRLNELQRDGSQLEYTLAHLNSVLNKLEKIKSELLGEKDSFNGRMMVLESERQNWTRQVQESENALSSALWKKDDSNRGYSASQNRISSSLHIKKSNAVDIRRSEDVSMLSYNSLARHEVIDFLERPKDIPTLPRYLQEEVMFPALKSSGKKMSFFKPSISPSASTSNHHAYARKSLASSLSTNSTLLFSGGPGYSSLSGSSSEVSSACHSPTHSIRSSHSSQDLSATCLNRVRSSSPYLHLRGSAFKGYTPSGAPGYRYHQEIAPGTEKYPSTMGRSSSAPGLIFGDDFDQHSIKSMSTIGMFSTKPGMLPSKTVVDNQLLDPVFYNELARSSFSRTNSLGKVRCQTAGSSPSPFLSQNLSVSTSSILSGGNITSNDASTCLSSMTGTNSKCHGMLLTSKHPGLHMDTRLN